MFRNLLILLITGISLFLKAQTQNFYYFGYQEKYGFTDSEGNETVPPSYDWQSFTVEEKSNYIALNGEDHEGIIINKITGELEKLSYFQDSYRFTIDDKDYLYAQIGNSGMLLNTMDLSERRKLPKKYESIKLVGNYLMGIIEMSEAFTRVDLIDLATMKVKKSGFKLQNFSSYTKEDDEKIIYVITQLDETIFLDEQFKQFGSTGQVLDDQSAVSNYLQEEHQIFLQTAAYDTMKEMEPRKFPFINSSREKGITQYYIYSSEKDRIPFFKIKNGRFNLYNDSFQNVVELRTKKEDKMYLKFFTDPVSGKVLLPQKYRDLIGLEMN